MGQSPPLDTVVSSVKDSIEHKSACLLLEDVQLDEQVGPKTRLLSIQHLLNQLGKRLLP